MRDQELEEMLVRMASQLRYLVEKEQEREVAALEAQRRESVDRMQRALVEGDIRGWWQEVPNLRQALVAALARLGPNPIEDHTPEATQKSRSLVAAGDEEILAS
jgi:hypothetical protein